MSKSQVVDTIKGKVGKLIEDNRKLRDDHDKISRQRDKLREDNRILTEKLAGLEKRIAILELKDGFAGGQEDNKIAMARINRLMREVDKCIALLEK